MPYFTQRMPQALQSRVPFLPSRHNGVTVNSQHVQTPSPWKASTSVENHSPSPNNYVLQVGVPFFDCFDVVVLTAVSVAVFRQVVLQQSNFGLSALWKTKFVKTHWSATSPIEDRTGRLAGRRSDFEENRRDFGVEDQQIAVFLGRDHDSDLPPLALAVSPRYG